MVEKRVDFDEIVKNAAYAVEISITIVKIEKLSISVVVMRRLKPSCYYVCCNKKSLVLNLSIKNQFTSMRDSHNIFWLIFSHVYLPFLICQNCPCLRKPGIEASFMLQT